MSGLHAELVGQRPDVVRVSGIPRAGVVGDVLVEQGLADGLTLAQVLAQPVPDGVSAEQLHAVGEDAGYRVAVSWGAQPGTLEAVFVLPELVGPAVLTDVYRSHPGAARGPHVNDPQTNTKISAVRQQLRTRLPDYMMPSQILVLDEFPMTSSGKIDRRNLPAPVFTTTSYRAPRTPVEKTIADIYADVLGLDHAGLDDDFFTLGGDSLSAMRLIAAIRSSLGVDISVPTVFEAPTVESLSRRVESNSVSVEVAPVQPLKPGTGAPLFCVHAGGGMSWAYHALSPYVDCPIIGIQQVPQEGETPPRSVQEMARNYADRIQRTAPTGPYRLLGWSFGGVVAHELAVELRRRGCEVEVLILLDAQPTGSDKGGLPDEEFGEAEMLESVLRMCNIEVPDQDEPLTVEQAEALLREHAAVEFRRYTYLRDLIVGNINTNRGLYRDYQPEIYDGDMVVFTAVGETETGPSATESWRPYVTGDIAEYRVDCIHADMLTVESVAKYGEQLRRILRGD
nr:MAG: hypothetical protein DIU75_15855 [Mycolicibacterium hassiacum]